MVGRSSRCFLPGRYTPCARVRRIRGDVLRRCAPRTIAPLRATVLVIVFVAPSSRPCAPLASAPAQSFSCPVSLPVHLLELCYTRAFKSPGLHACARVGLPPRSGAGTEPLRTCKQAHRVSAALAHPQWFGLRRGRPHPSRHRDEPLHGYIRSQEGWGSPPSPRTSVAHLRRPRTDPRKWYGHTSSQLHAMTNRCFLTPSPECSCHRR